MSYSQNETWPAPPTRSIIIWSITALFIVLQFFLQLSIGIMALNLRVDLSLTAFELAMLSSAYYVIYILLQTPTGILMDHFGPRKLLTWGGILCSLGCFGFAHSSSLITAMLFRLCMGGGTAFAFIASVNLAAKWFPFRYLGLMTGLAETCGMVGAMTGNMLLAFSLHSIGWRNSFLVTCAFTTILTFFAWFIIRDTPLKQNVQLRPKRKTMDFQLIFSNLKLLLKDKKIWLNSLYVSLMYVIVTVFSAIWANSYLIKAFDFSLQEATFACSLILVGTGIGSPIFGWIFASHKARKQFMILCPLISLLIISVILYLPTLPKAAIYALMLGLGTSASSLILSYTLAGELAPPLAKNTSIGFTNTIALLSAPIGQLLIGFILDQLSDKISPELGIEVYSVTQYNIALSLLPIVLIIAFFIATKLPDPPNQYTLDK